MQSPHRETRRESLISSALLVGICFLPSLLFEGSHPGEAAVAAIATVSSVGPAGSTSLPDELASMWSASLTFIRGIGQESRLMRRNAS